MKVGDLVRHKYSVLMGTGIILSICPYGGKQASILWTAHGKTQIHETMVTYYLEVINEKR